MNLLPVVDAENVDDEKAWQYIYEKPTALPKYLQEFKHKNDDSIDIVPGPAISTCPGIPGFTKSHSYLLFEGSEKCLLCDVSLCKTCCYRPTFFSDYKPKKVKHYFEWKPPVLCVFCYKNKSIPKYIESDNIQKVEVIDNNDSEKNKVTIDDMRKFLKDSHVNLRKSAPKYVVQGSYHKKKTDSSYYSCLPCTPMPEKSICFFETCEPFYAGRFDNGAIFLGDDTKIKNNDVIGILLLFGRQYERTFF